MAVQQWTYFTIQNSVPLAPTITGIAQVPGATPTFSLSWTANPSGRPASGYRVHFYRADGTLVRGPIDAATSGTQYTLTTAPTYGSNYYATIAGSNFAGILAQATSSSPGYVITYGQAPIAPPASVTMIPWTSATPLVIFMTWTPPATAYTYAPVSYYSASIGTGTTIGTFSAKQSLITISANLVGTFNNSSGVSITVNSSTSFTIPAVAASTTSTNISAMTYLDANSATPLGWSLTLPTVTRTATTTVFGFQGGSGGFAYINQGNLTMVVGAGNLYKSLISTQWSAGQTLLFIVIYNTGYFFLNGTMVYSAAYTPTTASNNSVPFMFNRYGDTTYEAITFTNVYFGNIAVATDVYSPVIGTTYYGTVTAGNTYFYLGSTSATAISATGTLYGTAPASVSPVNLAWSGAANTMTFTWTNSVNNTYNTVSTYWLQIFYNTNNVAVNTSLNNATSFWGPYSSLAYGWTNTSFSSATQFSVLTIGNYYSAAVWASNAVGSNISVSGTTQYGTIPAAFTATCVWDTATDTNLKVSWTNPVDSTYNTPYSYYSVGVFRTDGATLLAQSGYSYVNTSFSGGYNFGTLNPGYYYYAIIQSSNAVGVRQSQSGNTRFGTAPPAATGASISINYSGGYLTANWSLPSTTAKNAISSVSVQFYYSNGTAFGSSIGLGASATSTTSSGFSAGNTYYAIIYTNNGIGSGSVTTGTCFIVGTPVFNTVSNANGLSTLRISWNAVAGATSYILYTNGNGGVNIGNVLTYYNGSISNAYYNYSVAASDGVTTGLQNGARGAAYYTTAGTYTLSVAANTGTAVIATGAGGGCGYGNGNAIGGSGGYVYGYFNSSFTINYVIVGGGGSYGTGGTNGGANAGNTSYGGGGGGVTGVYGAGYAAYLLVGGGGGCGSTGTAGTSTGSPIGDGGNGGGSTAASGGGTQGGVVHNSGLNFGGTMNGGAGGSGGTAGAGGSSSWASGASGSGTSGGQGASVTGNSNFGQGGGGAGGWGGGGGGGAEYYSADYTYWDCWSQHTGNNSQAGGAGGGGGSDYTGYVSIINQSQGSGGKGATSTGNGADGAVYLLW
jgi:hypothetical protein